MTATQHPGIPAVRKHMRLLPGHAIVEMHPIPEEIRGIYRVDHGTNAIRDTHKRHLLPATLLSDIYEGNEQLDAGSTVLMVAADGKRIDDFTLPEWASDQEVRLLGIVCERLGRPLDMPLTETILGAYDPDRDGAIRPTLSNILLRLPERREKTGGGIYLPDNCKDRPTDTAEAIAVGPNVKRVRAGETVIFERRALFWIGVEGFDDLAFILEDGVYSVLEGVA